MNPAFVALLGYTEKELLENPLIQFVHPDDRGFNTSEKSNGVELHNIKNRVGLYGGKAEIKSNPGEGCQLYVQIPYKQKMKKNIKEPLNFEMRKVG